jgi:hypothetical protein
VEEMKKNFIIILVLLFLTVFISGCIGFLTTPGDDSIAPGKGKLEIYLTDSSEKYKVNDPETYSEVNITISEIKVHLAGDDEGEWIEWPLDEETEYNLIELENVSVLLSEGQLEPGKYTQIRLFITNSNIFLIGGEKYITLIIPSVYETGIKLIHPFEIVEGEITKLIIDFDAEKSVVKTGNGEYKLKPVIKVASETYLVGDLFEYPGSISGSVVDSEGSLPISDATVSVSLSSSVYIFTVSIVTEQDGLFFIEQLPVGTYTLNVSAEGYIDYTEDGIVVAEGTTTSDIDIVLVPVI